MEGGTQEGIYGPKSGERKKVSSLGPMGGVQVSCMVGVEDRIENQRERIFK